MSVSEQRVGFIGLGNMGKPMAGHVAKSHAIIVYDAAGSAERAPDGAKIAAGCAEIAKNADIIVLSLPSVAANAEVVGEIATAGGKKDTLVIDTCTIGVEAAQANAKRLTAAGLSYVDAPVSGLAVRAREGTLATMCSGAEQDVERARAVIECYSRLLFRVGEHAGQGQRMKLVNNALCIAQYVISSEALVYGERGGLDMQTMLDVINESSGMNFSTSFIFPKYVATERYDESGAEAHVPCKDLDLFVNGAAAEGTAHDAVRAAFEVFKAFTDEQPTRDQMRIYPYVKSNSDS